MRVPLSAPQPRLAQITERLARAFATPGGPHSQVAEAVRIACDEALLAPGSRIDTNIWAVVEGLAAGYLIQGPRLMPGPAGSLTGGPVRPRATG